jgi:RNA polymerase sigma factor (sigma-70 family)
MTRKQQEEIFEEVIENHKNRIGRICKVYAANPDTVKDLFQEVIFNIWKSIPGFNGDAALSTWIYRISLNVCLRHSLKLNRKENTISIEDMQFEISEKESDDNLKERYKILYQCIEQLNEVDKSIVLLFLEDLPYKEISEITGLSENHIAVKMGRIRKQLFNCLTN